MRLADGLPDGFTDADIDAALAAKRGSSHYPVCSKPAITLSRKDWHSAANRAVLGPFRTRGRFGILPRRLHGPGGAAVVAANDAAPTQWRIPMVARLTDTQLVILSSASQRHDRGVDLPANVAAEALRKPVDKLIRRGLLEEVCAKGALGAGRRDVEAGPMALRIPKQGLDAIGVKDDATGAPTQTSTCASPDGGEAEIPAAKSSRQRTSAVAHKLAGKKQQPGKTKTKARSPRESRPGSKQA